MSWPLATASNDPISALRSDVDQKSRAAKEAWEAFDGFRKEKGESGLARDGEAFERAMTMKRTYELAASEHEDARKAWESALERKAGVYSHGGSGWPTNIGRKFIKALAPDGQKAIDATVGGTMVGAFFDPQIRDLPQRALFIRSLIPVAIAQGDKVNFIRQTVATQAAAPVAAGAVKPTSTYTLEKVEQAVTTIAHVTEALDRALLSDFEELASFLDQQLRLGVLLAEEAQILNGNGTPPNLRGILNTSGIQTQAKGADSQTDAVYKAMTKLRLVAFLEPDGIVLHPTDLQTIRLSKDTTGNYQAGPLGEDDPGLLFGKPVITSPVIAQGTGLVGCFVVGAKVYDREQARVTFAETGLGDSAGQELFTRNQVRFRGEERVAFGVSRPSAFCTVTGL